MLKDGSSYLKLYSIAIVVEDKKRDSDEILVFPVEEMPFSEGKISEIKKKYNHSLPNVSGKPIQSNIESSVTLKAKWINLGDSNRNTSPDVIKNETVILFQFGDTNEYYWTTIFREPGIRRQEVVCYMFGDLKEPLKKWDKESSYWLEYNTVDKHIHLHTSNSDKEPFIYDIKIDTLNGNILIKDDAKNSILFDSKESKITIDIDYYVVNARKDVEINGIDNIRHNTKDFTEEVGNNLVSNIKNESTTKVGKTIGMAIDGGTDIKIDKSFDLKNNENTKIESNSTTVKSTEQLKLEGPTEQKGPLGVLGTFGLNGIDLTGVLSSLKDTIKGVTDGISSITDTITAIQSQVTSVTDSVTTLTSDMSGIKTEITDIISRLENLEG